MNYRHAYHAGNFADVFKHALLTICLDYLKTKEKPFFVLDTHSGIGFYDLLGDEAEKTGEWQSGIAQLLDAEQRHPDAAWLKPLQTYLDAVRAENPDGGLRFYPGSPRLSQRLSRPQDRVFLCELHPDDEKLLMQSLHRDARVKVENRDGYEALTAVLPPKERRGLVLIDPPFEKRDEFEAMERALEKGLRRWATGTFALWYPIKDRLEVASFHAHLDRLQMHEALAVDLYVRSAQSAHGTSVHNTTGALIGCGYVLVNPPYGLMQCLDTVMDGLTFCLGQDGSAHWSKRPLGAGKPQDQAEG